MLATGYVATVSHNRKGAFGSVSVTMIGFLLITALYLVVLRASVDVTRTDLGRSAETRDITYLMIHGSVLMMAVILGFALGRIVSGMGLAFALLFIMLSLTMMATVQIGSFSLACNGHNDLIRHWTC